MARRPPVSRTTSIEPFPTLTPVITQDDMGPPPTGATLSKPQRRRTSSNLPGEPRGDTGAAALATISDQEPADVAASPVRSASDRSHRPFGRGYKRRRAKTLFRRWKSMSLRHTWVNPLVLALAILSCYAVSPGDHNPVSRAIFLSYPVAGTSPVEYGKGGNDFAFVAFYTIVLSFTREFLMQRFIKPLAVWFGIHSRAKQSRFMEQVYTAVYFGVAGPFGVYVMSRSPVWYFDTRGMFEGFPHRQHEGLFKAYYLLQAAYWSQQAIVLLLQLEAPRKDFKELVAHHIVTIALIWLSYRFHFAFMGLAVYITHDISDFFLAISKTLNYLDSRFTSSWFAIFVCVWAYARHYLNLRLIWAVLTDFRTIGPFELDWETQQYKCWISQIITFLLLASLQALNLFWFYLVLRIAKRIVFDAVVADERSDDGDEADDDAGSTDAKRRALGIAGNDQKAGVNGAPPTVLLNGMPVDGDAHVAKMSSARTSGRQSPAAKAQARRKA